MNAQLVRPLTCTAMSASPASSHSPSVQQNKKQLESGDPGKNKTDKNQWEITQAETSESEKTQEEAARREIASTEATQQENTAVEVQDFFVVTEAEHKAAMRKFTAIVANTPVPDDWQPLPLDPNIACPYNRAYLYRGTVLLSAYLVVDAPQYWARYRGRPSDVFVASFPKSGTTWLQEIVWRVVHRETGPESGAGQTLEYRFPLLDLPSATQVKLAPLHDMESPRLIKTHLMYHLLPESVHTSGAKVLYVSRDPRDVCVSYYIVLY